MSPCPAAHAAWRGWRRPYPRRPTGTAAASAPHNVASRRPPAGVHSSQRSIDVLVQGERRRRLGHALRQLLGLIPYRLAGVHAVQQAALRTRSGSGQRSRHRRAARWSRASASWRPAAGPGWPYGRPSRRVAQRSSSSGVILRLLPWPAARLHACRPEIAASVAFILGSVPRKKRLNADHILRLSCTCWLPFRSSGMTVT